MPQAALRSIDSMEPSPLQILLDKISHPHNAPAYAGDISPRDAYEYMRDHASLLVDVRTAAEWQFVGMPEMVGTKARLVTLSWKLYPTFAPNTEFAGMLAAESADRNMPIFFICRSGGRSLDAAAAMTAQGYRYCFNILGGFEGEPDEQGHRGIRDGWKAAKLPWKQG